MSAAVRAFVALELEEEARRTLGEWMAETRPRLPGFKWVEEENLHLTLRFLGDTPTARLGELERSLAAAAAGVAPFAFAIRGAGAFPDAAAPRVLWAGVAAGPELAALHRRVEEAVRALGWEAERTPFRAHITLARARAPRPRPDVAAFLAEVADCFWAPSRAAEMTLFQSTLTPAGPVYRPLARFPLGR